MEANAFTCPTLDCSGYPIYNPNRWACAALSLKINQGCKKITNTSALEATSNCSPTDPNYVQCLEDEAKTATDSMFKEIDDDKDAIKKQLEQEAEDDASNQAMKAGVPVK